MRNEEDLIWHTLWRFSFWKYFEILSQNSTGNTLFLLFLKIFLMIFFFQFWTDLFGYYLCRILVYSQSKLNGFFSHAKLMERCFSIFRFFLTKDFSKKWFNFLIFWLNCNRALFDKFSSSFLSLWLKKIDHAIFRKLLVEFYSSSDF